MSTPLSFLSAFKLAAAFAVVGVLVYLVYILGDIIVMFLTAALFAVALDRPLDKLVERNISRPLAAGIIYATFFAALVGLLYLVVPVLAVESNNFLSRLPQYAATVSPSGTDLVSEATTQTRSVVAGLETLASLFGTGSQSIVSTITSISGGLVTFLVIYFVALFLNIERDGVQRFITLFVPAPRRVYASDLLRRIQIQLGYWLWGKVVSSLFVSILVFFGLIIIGIDYALTFALLTFFLNFIPFAGPTISAIVPSILGFLISPWHGIAVIALFFIANNLEGFVFLPLVMKRSIDMNPALLVFAVLVGGKVAGIVGIIIAIPVTAIVTLLYDEHRTGWGKTTMSSRPLTDSSSPGV